MFEITQISSELATNFMEGAIERQYIYFLILTIFVLIFKLVLQNNFSHSTS